jgi:purine-nucleoside phosphorylase
MVAGDDERTELWHALQTPSSARFQSAPDPALGHGRTAIHLDAQRRQIKPAEIRMLRAIGADAVGMSTVPEVIVAVHGGMRVLGLSIITDMCLPDSLQEATLDEIVATANAAQPNLTALVRGVLERL